MLSVDKCAVRYGAVEALRGVSFSLQQQEIMTLIGSNGAGKSTMVMAICGLVPLHEGAMSYEGVCLSTLSPRERLAEGIACSPEGRRVFPKMTVFENLQMGCLVRGAEDFASNLEFVYTLFPRLQERREQLAGTMSGGEQQMLAIARALMANPRLLLLDEPSLGLAPLIIQQIFRVITQLNQEKKMTILLVEQNANLALKAAHRGIVLANGRVMKEGTGKELLQDPDVRSAYLEG